METEAPYTVYEIRSPSGKSYVGLTKQPVARRFHQHRMNAKTKHEHPFYAALRKYGNDQFTFHILESGLNREEARYFEAAYIATRAAQGASYNLSPGGEADGDKAAERFKELVQDSNWFEWYRNRLVQGVLSSEAHKDWRRHGLQAAQKTWRANNPKEVYAIAHRASRMASPGCMRRTERTQFGRMYIPSEKVRRARQAYAYKTMTKKRWAQLSKDEKATVAGKISQSVAEHHRNLSQSEKAEVDDQLAKARDNIDHDYRKRRQKEALQAYWTPERRAQKSAEMKAKRAAEKANQ